MSPTVASLAVPLAAAFGASLALTPAVRRAARVLDIVSTPSPDRWNERPTALLGGIAIFGGVTAGLLAIGVPHGVARGGLRALEQFGRPGLGVIIAAALMFATGLADDRFDFRPATKLVMQAVSAAALMSFGVLLRVTGAMPVDMIITFFWFIGITNAMNLLDNMDGVATGIAGLAALFLAFAFAQVGAWPMTAVCLTVVGAAAGFLPYNFHRASIFMGDSGSLFLGALLAGLGAAYPHVASGNVFSVLAIPVFVVVIPILDTLLVTVSRTLAGRPISMGGKDHTTHRLVALGFSQRQTALLLYGLAAVSGTAALVLPGTLLGLWMATALLVALAVFAAFLFRTHEYDTQAEGGDGQRKLTLVVSDLLHKRRALEVLLDIVLFSAAHVGAYLLRYDAFIPATQLRVLESTLAVAVCAKLLGFLVAGAYRGTWNHVGIRDFYRLLNGVVFGTLLTVAAFVFGFRNEEFSRSIFLLDSMLVLLLTTGVRFAFRSLHILHQASASRVGVATLIYGTGRLADTAMREMLGNVDVGMRPVGFIDDDPKTWQRLVHGLPVLGGGVDLPELLARRRVGKLVIAASLRPDRIRAVRQAASIAGVDLFHMDVTFHAVPSLITDEPLPGALPMTAPTLELLTQRRGRA